MEKQETTTVKLSGFIPSFQDIVELHNVKYRFIRKHEEITLFGVNKSQIQFIIDAGKYLWSGTSFLGSNHNGSFYFATINNEDFSALLALMDNYSINYIILGDKPTPRMTIYLDELTVDIGIHYYDQIVEVE